MCGKRGSKGGKNLRQKKTPLEKSWEQLLKKEEKLCVAKQNKRESKLNQLLAEKVPVQLQSTLDTAFYKAFLLIFEKGTKLIEKTYNKEEQKTVYKVREYEDILRNNKKSLKTFSKHLATRRFLFS